MVLKSLGCGLDTHHNEVIGADPIYLTQQEVGKWLMTFRQFPPRQATASFTIDRMMQQMQQMLQMKSMAAAKQGKQ